MGWLYMQSLAGHATPKAYPDAQFTYTRDGRSSRVLKSALVGMRTYYAAVETQQPGAERQVWALVCLVRYNPRDREGFIFGYKDMDETMGPCEDACPKAILDLLTPTDWLYAVAWRTRCHERLEDRRKLAAKPLPQPGDTVVFDEPIRFRDGSAFTRLEAVRLPGRRGPIFQAANGALYRIVGLKGYAYRIEGRTETAQLRLG
jgi:hypothetical protein